jgi:hypothetical protein
MFVIPYTRFSFGNHAQSPIILTLRTLQQQQCPKHVLWSDAQHLSCRESKAMYPANLHNCFTLTLDPDSAEMPGEP